MKLTNIVSLTSSSVVNNGEDIQNVFTTKNQHKKKKEIKLGKTSYGGVGIGINSSLDSDGDNDGDTGAGDSGGGDSAGGGDGG